VGEQFLPSDSTSLSATIHRPLSTTLNLSLTDELRAFVDENCGDGTLYSTPSEFVRNVLREKKARLESAQIRDAIHRRTVPYRGDLVNRHFLVCDLHGETVVVLTVLHSSMDLPTRLLELEPSLIAESQFLQARLHQEPD
jgi:antitoxin ParD1/3/4